MVFLFNLNAQTSGLVLNLEGKPIDNVSVFYTDKNILLSTNEDGIFSFNELMPDNSYLHFYKYGYASKLIKYSEAKL